MATPPKFVDIPPGDPLGTPGFPNPGNIMKGVTVDLSLATITLYHKIPNSNPARYFPGDVPLADFIKYIVNTAKGQ